MSFETPEYTANADALGTLRLLEAIRILGLEKKTRFYQASTPRCTARCRRSRRRETTPFYPRSPYGAAKVYAYWITVNYREAYGMYACNGILFNHESPIRGETFVTRKITRGLARIQLGLQECLYLGNLDALRDWGHARDYVRAQWLMLQQAEPDDYVIATGEQHSVREFVELPRRNLGMRSNGVATGVDEQGVDAATGRSVVKIDPRYFRPTEVDTLLGDRDQGHGEARLEAGERLSTNSVKEMVDGGPRAGASATRMVARAGLQDLTGIMNEADRDLRRGPSRTRRVGAIVRRLSATASTTGRCARSASSICATRRPSTPSSQRERPEYVFLAAAKVGGILANDTLSGRFHPRQPADPDERDRCRLSPWRAEAAVSGLELHLPEARAAADAGGVPADRPAGADERAVRDREDRRPQDVPGLSAAVRLQRDLA